MFVSQKSLCRHVCRISVFLMMYSGGALSQPEKKSVENTDTLLTLSPKMKITVTRLEVEAEQLPQKVEVIDEIDLRLTAADDVTDVLKKNSSIDVIQYPGLLAGVGIRGFRPSYSGINQRTLTLLDGRPAGATNLSTMQTYNIERIEVVKGPVSALYGPQAMGGVVNIIPKRSEGNVNTQMKLKIGSFETLEAVAHSGGSLFDFLNYDLSAAVFNRGKDYRIGSEYSLSKLNDEKFTGKPKHILENGDTVEVDDKGNGMIRHWTKYDKKNFALRLGTDILDDRISIDLRGEMFGADAVETPGDIAYGDQSPGFKNVYRNDEQLTVRGNFDRNKFKILQYWAQEYAERFEGFEYEETMYKYYSSGADFSGFQLKDDIYFPVSGEFFEPVVTFGLDYNRAEAWSRKWEQSGHEIAPYSPNSIQKDLGLYTQVFGDLKDGFVTATAGFRFDRITAEIPESKFFPNNAARDESFNVFSPSFGLTLSPLKTVIKNAAVTLYTNLGKGFIPQSAGNIAGYSIGAPDTTARVQILKGNPDLKPEENITVDFGVRTSLEKAGVSLGFGGYRTVVENFVEYSYNDVPEGLKEVYQGDTFEVATIKTYKNNDDQTILAGLEWEFDWNILRLFNRKEKLVFSTNGHAILVSEIISGADTSEVHNVRNPQFTVGLTYDDMKHLSFRLSSRYSGEQLDTDWSSSVYPEPDIIYPPFLVTDLSMRVKINENHSIGAQISNVTDENYYEKRGYNLPGRTFGLDYELSF